MKNLSYLIESELEKAEVVLAAKSITDAIQKMAETVAKMEAEDVMPLNDPIRQYFGPEAASAFADAVSGKLRELTAALSSTKNAVSDEIARMQGELDGIPQNDLSSMDDDGLGDDAGPDGDTDVANADLGDEPEADDSGFSGGEDDAEPADGGPAIESPAFDDAEMGSLKAAGRARKEGVAPRGKMIETHVMGMETDEKSKEAFSVQPNGNNGYYVADEKERKMAAGPFPTRKEAEDKAKFLNAKKVNEAVSPDRIVAQEFVAHIREGKSPADAAALINETYGLSIDSLITIVESFKK